ncbi:unnamed protein product [Phaeothamnion confervicola]
MGRRKASTKKISTKKKRVLETIFKCPFCSHDKVVECKVNAKEKIGTLVCRRCEVKYSTVANYLTEPIDVYTEWIDACEAENAANGDEEEV